ncbi:efflux RND transporter periplasmic adaptor subunit [Novosphingobium malaysiense]|uniref:Multidrug resistance protein MdtA-like barrel-sandwich hybrid domain-containing protein n=1 Tax=Novosphingobium malaysiense TaxID=1348853 RepID=A0A0B1ZUN4_9SPHN|nr:HlyD family efflux transporter periplasmic adaptor subunit [Novosphingobium malaysiense]KHK92883.1 hypothetical protein LK12_00270 [Novosphingobium malaysiense]
MSEDNDHGHSPLDALLGASPRRGRRHLAAVVLLAVALIASAFLAYRFLRGNESPYYFAPAEIGDLTPQVSERGVVRGSRDLAVRASLDGTITRLPAAPGGPVQRGQELARIDAGPAKQLLEADKARLEAAKADLEAASVIADQKAGVLARFERVWAKSGGRVPARNEMEDARAEATRSKQAQKAAQDRLHAARMALAARRKQIEDSVLRAPFSGFLSKEDVQVGQYVREGTLLFRLTPEDDALEITVPWVDGGASDLKPGARAAVRVESLPDRTLEARLLRIERERGDPKATFLLENPGTQVIPGLQAELEIALPARRNVLLVPSAALEFAPESSTDRTRAQVYLLGEDGTPQRVYVTAGASDGRRTEIFSGTIKPGAQVIIGMRDAPQD